MFCASVVLVRCSRAEMSPVFDTNELGIVINLANTVLGHLVLIDKFKDTIDR